MILLARALPVFSVAFLMGSNCGGFTDCPCIPCTGAVDMSVVDSAGNALNTGWIVDATVDGVAVPDVSNCDINFRVGNECTFGQDTGIYRINVSGDGFLTRQKTARFAAKSGEDCCRVACLGPALVEIVLDPAP